jgi:hypothetical protein
MKAHGKANICLLFNALEPPRQNFCPFYYLRDALDNSRKAWEIRPRFTTDDQQTCRFDSPKA